MARGLMVGIIVTLLSLFFTKLHIANVGVTLIIILLTSMLFSLGGFINGIFARSFDDISIIPTFVLTPLTYLGGVFYSIQLLPDFWQKVSMANPILYMVNSFRYGILGVSDINVGFAFTMILLFAVGMFVYALYLLKNSKGLRT
jgi:ABC-2 type transport system permease protein